MATLDALYPGWENGGFRVAGFLATFPASTSPPPSDVVIADFNFWGLHLRARGPSPDLDFQFGVLSRRCFAAAIRCDRFDFSCTQKYLGDVTYRSLEPIDPEVPPWDRPSGPTQGITSLNVTGGWTVDGLRLTMKGELGGISQDFKKPTPAELKQASYWIELQIPWSALRFLLYDDALLVRVNYNTHVGRPVDEELYPGLTSVGFRVGGFATTLPLRPKDAHDVGIDLSDSLSVAQTGLQVNPSFGFHVLTPQYLAHVIENDAAFNFSLVHDRIGDVVYVSGAGARDYAGNVQQRIISLHATGAWRKQGLRLNMEGKLGEMSHPDEVIFKQASYRVELSIPWAVLRFFFYDKIHFVWSNYETYARGAE
jgi:hypothetical protein